jgi:uncharacterized protein
VIQIPAARSLKDRRQVVRSFKERVQARLHISIAEVGNLELHQRAELGVAVVSNEPAVCDELLASVVHAANTLRDAVLVDHASEIVPFGEAGSGLRGGLAERGVGGPATPTTPTDDDEEYDEHG